MPEQSQTTQTRPVNLLANPKGELLTGFPRYFLQASLKTTLRFPQTQAVIRIAVANTILKAIEEGRTEEIIALYKDVHNRSGIFINIPPISKYVSNHYEELGIGKMKFSDIAYAKLFRHELLLASHYMTSICNQFYLGENAAIGKNAFGLLPKRAQDENDLDRGIPELAKVNPEFRGHLSDIFDKVIRSIYVSPKANRAVEVFLENLRTYPRPEEQEALQRWRDDIIAPYASTITKISDSTLISTIKERKHPEMKNPKDYYK